MGKWTLWKDFGKPENHYFFPLPCVIAFVGESYRLLLRLNSLFPSCRTAYSHFSHTLSTKAHLHQLLYRCKHLVEAPEWWIQQTHMEKAQVRGVLHWIRPLQIGILTLHSLVLSTLVIKTWWILIQPSLLCVSGKNNCWLLWHGLCQESVIPFCPGSAAELDNMLLTGVTRG